MDSKLKCIFEYVEESEPPTEGTIVVSTEKH